MNILTDALPGAVVINGREYEIDTDFRAALRTILAFEDDSLTAIEKRAILLNNLYREQPGDLQAAFEVGVRFLDGGKSEEASETGPRVFSFAKDANLIFAAFKQTHGIDLQTEQLHWWAFLALFMDLGADTAFCNLVSLRKRVKTGQATKEERRVAREMGEAFDIPEIDDRTTEEREQEAEFLRLVAEGEKNRGSRV